MSVNKSVKKVTKEVVTDNKDFDWINADVEEKYEKKNELDHILTLPDTHIGSTEFTDYNFWIPAKTVDGDFIFTKQDVQFTPGFYKIFDEIIVNAYDQYVRLKEIGNKIREAQKKEIAEVMESLRTGDPKSKKDAELREKAKTLKTKANEPIDISFLKNIKINIDPEERSISIYNDGEGIDVAIHKEHNIYIPQMIFGEMRTSGNYSKNKTGIKTVGGRNGYGGKLANIFSHKFILETGDRRRKLQFYQVYTNNMKQFDEPIIKPYNGSGFTRITFFPDLERFGYMDGFDDTIMHLIVKRAYDLSVCTDPDVSVYLNDTKIECKSFDTYVSYYLDDSKNILHKKFNDRWEIVACLSPNQTFDQVSFVNGISTIRGGKHVDYISGQLVKKLKDYIENKKKIKNLKLEHVRDNLMLFIKCSIDDAAFDTQTKEALTTISTKFGSKCDIDDEFVDNLANKCGIMDRVVQWHEMKSNLALKKTDGAKSRTLNNIPKLDDAEWAGTTKSEQTCLILTEGDSAKAMAMAGRTAVKDANGNEMGYKIFGVFPLRGKLLNVGTSTNDQILNNAEIINLKKILGLQEGVKYTDTKKLRYGSILIMTDQDPDGSHIKGLLMNLFRVKWPSLLEKKGFIRSLLTPLIKLSKGNSVMNFYSIPQFTEWSKDKDISKYTIKYYKGLGTSTPKEAKEYFAQFLTNTYVFTDTTLNKLDLAFMKDRVEDRKTWLQAYDITDTLNYANAEILYEDFIDKDLIHFSAADCIRSIPSVVDGLKVSQRKVLYGVDLKKMKAKDEIKVAQLAGFIAEKTEYHHGEVSLCGTIVNMAQNFTGSNNINTLSPLGQFGTRLTGGHDSASPRYIFTNMTPIGKFIYNSLDKSVYKYRYEGEMQVEPFHYVPVIPMILINGTNGIGTGYSTTVQPHNPIDVFKCLRQMLADDEPSEIMPWFRGFMGTIVKLKQAKYITKGIYSYIDKNTIEITELPVGTWSNDYKEFLDSILISGSYVSPSKRKIRNKSNIVDNKKEEKEAKVVFLKGYTAKCSDTSVSFTLTFEEDVLYDLLAGSPDKEGINLFEKTFKLASKLSETNMWLYDEEYKLKHYETTKDIIIDFYNIRLKTYAQRRDYLLDKYKYEMEFITWKAMFIQFVIEKKIIVNNKPKSEIYIALENLKFPKIIMTETKEDDNINASTKSKKMFTADQFHKIPTEDAAKGYDYLLLMPIYSLTMEKYKELLEEKNAREAEFNALSAKSSKDLWIEDLDQVENAYKSHMADYWDQNGKDFKKTYDEVMKNRNKPKYKLKSKVEE